MKTFGNIVCFRNLEDEVNAALALFGDKDASGIVLLKTYNEYLNGYEDNGKHVEGYLELIKKLEDLYPVGTAIVGKKAQTEFIKLFSAILRLRNILVCFDEFESNNLLSQRDLQDYQSVYIDLYQDFSKAKDADKENINDDIVFEIELIKQVEVNIDYILMLVAKYHASNCEDKNILMTIDKTINSSIQLRSKKELIEGFIAKINTATNVDKDWRDFVRNQKEQDLTTIITDENLKPEETKKLIDGAFRDGALKTTGTDIDKILPPVSRFAGGNRAGKKQSVIEKFLAFFEKYFGLA